MLLYLLPLRHLSMLALALTLCAAGVSQESTAGSDPLAVLVAKSASRRGEGLLRDWLRQESRSVLELRLERFEALKTPDAIATYRRDLRSRFVEALGGFPERTPLNARVVGQIQGKGFRIEKILFESQPGFFVSGLLYLPESGLKPYPVALMPCGHSAGGKTAYQAPAALLAKNGIAVFCIDPIGQGERRQLPKDLTFGRQGAPPGLFNPTNEHTILSVAPILIGRNLATDMIWDGIRAIDYLETRPDLDPKRIACVGNSGGGMMTSYLLSLDERLVGGGIGCFMTTSVRKNESPGPGDAEQNIFGQYSFGLDLPDYLVLAAPRPVVVLAATRDYVPIVGTWEAFREAKRIYTRLGYPERVDLIETDATHGFSLQLREGAVRWLRRWLCDDNRPVFEQELPRFTDAELACTPEGNVQALPGARSVLDLNRAAADGLAEVRREAWSRSSDIERRVVVRRIAGIRYPEKLSAARIESRGRLNRDGMRIEKLVLMREGDVPLPALRLRPEGSATHAVIYVHGRGKRVDAVPGGPIAAMVAAGADVLAVDLRGFGETAMDGWRTTPVAVAGPNAAEFHVAYMLGRSFVGLRAEDILTTARSYTILADALPGPPELVAVEEAGIPALHAAAVAPVAFSSVSLVRTLDSWHRLFEPVVPERQLESVVHGALRFYDLPDLVSLSGRVSIQESAKAAGRPLVAR